MLLLLFYTLTNSVDKAKPKQSRVSYTLSWNWISIAHPHRQLWLVLASSSISITEF